MRNIRLTLAYDGTNYVGWQVQPNGTSVQSTVEEAVRKLTGASARLTVAGRTDSGVHALGQVANFPTESSIPCERIRAGLQNFLPDDIVVREAIDVDSSFHATYSAKSKRYRYVIFNSRMSNPFVRRYAWQYSSELDALAMHQAAQVLLGTHDFRCFESHFPNKKTSVRTITETSVTRQAGWPIWHQADSIDSSETTEIAATDAAVAEIAPRTDKLATPPDSAPFVVIEVVADGFLYNMVRAIVGTLLEVGRGKWTGDDVRQIIENQDRSQAGVTVPLHGLYLVHVEYSDQEPVPNSAPE